MDTDPNINTSQSDRTRSGEYVCSEELDIDALEGIAIIGMSGRFPGAKNVNEFWDNLIEGVDCISRFSEDELEFSNLSAESRQAGRKTVAARGILEDVDKFDAEFFGIYPREAEIMDPQHRVFLECAWESLESAGYVPETYPGMIGVYAGVSLNTYLLYNLNGDGRFASKLAGNYQVGEYQAMLGNDKDFMPTRVSYKLNLKGPSMAVQTACSSSLVAISQACASLEAYQCDMALAGGVSITFPQRRDYLFEEEGLASVDGTCRTFDAEAKGTVFGHGSAVLLLKRVQDAIQDGDNILAVIRGTAINNDGSDKIGYAAPSVNAQADVIAMAQAAADIHPSTISYIEAHGTGTPLGDPIEIAALTKAFRDGGADGTGFCAIGSGKPNISHLDVASGATGLIKTVMQLQRGIIPPLLHFRSANPNIDFANSPFCPVEKATEWKRNGHPRRAGVSAFGVGGTNTHVVVEEAPSLPPSTVDNHPQIFPLSARTESALDSVRANLAHHLQEHTELNLADVAYTLQVGRKPFDYRSTYIASNREELLAALDQPLKPKSIGKVSRQSPPVVFMFPGQGAQYVGMGRELYDEETIFRTEVDRCAETLEAHLGQDIRTILYPADDQQCASAEVQINETWMTQPAIFVAEYAMARQFQAWGVTPDVLIGHSIGEYVCAVLAETFTLDDALALLAKRAKFMQALPAGSMLGVRLCAGEVQPLLPEGASIAAENSPKLCTVSGPTSVLETFQRDLESKSIASRMLATSHAFHSSMMDPMLEEFTQAAELTTRLAPQIPWVSTFTGKAVTAEDMENAEYWSGQLRHAVRFSSAMDSLLADYSNCVFLEVGPGRALGQFVRQHASKIGSERIVASLLPTSTPEDGASSLDSSNRHNDCQSALTALANLWTAGVQPDWGSIHGLGSQDDEHLSPSRRRVELPTYPFERKSFWVEPKHGGNLTTADSDPSSTSLDEATTCSEAVNSCVSSSAPPNASMVESSASTEEPDVTPEQSPREVIAAELRSILLELSGMNIDDDEATFIDLGFDSLFLSQASQAIDSRFGIKITFRQLLGDLSSVAAIADFLENELPEEKLASLRPASFPSSSQLPTSADALVDAPAMVGVQNPADVQRMLDSHLHNIQQLLKASRSQSSGSGNRLRSVRRPSSHSADKNLDKSQSASKRFGPYKPIEKGEQGGLTQRQQDALDRLIQRYVQKTKKSKDYTEEHRPHFADPRAVSGFRSQWKEMVYPIVSQRSKGSKIWDIDGNEYVDITMGFGTYFFGHSPDWLIEALEKQLHTGIEIGPQSALAGKVAKMISEFTGLERVTFCNTGSEAVMAAMRLARTVTGRDRIVYFSGDYHGMFEEVLVRGAWPNGEYSAQPIAPGIPKSLVENILVLEYGSPESLEIIREHADEIAAVMVEPVQSRDPSHQPREFMHKLRELTQDTGSALIFDEVVTGFRCHQGGAQAYFGIEADMATYGKVVGGGIPIGILAGSQKYMDALDGGTWQYGDDSFPEVGVTFFAGTFVRHPLAIAAAHAVLNFLKESGPELQTQMTERVSELCQTINEHMETAQVPIRMSSFSAVAGIEYASDLKYASLLWYYLREKGIHIWEGRPCYFTIAHSDEDLQRFVNAFVESVREMQADGFLPQASGESFGGHGGTDTIERFPLAEGQREMWLGAQMSPDAAGPHHACNAFVLEGDLDVDALRAALSRVVGRHEALRATFNLDGTEVLVHSDLDIELIIDDLTNCDAHTRQQRVDEIMESEARKILDLSDGPLIQVRLLKLGKRKHQLIFTVQMIVCDGWSHYVLFEELSEIYSSLRENRPPVLKDVVPMRQFAEWQRDFQASPEAESCKQYWLNQYQTVPAPLDLPTKATRPLTRTVDASRTDILIPNSFYEEIKSYGRTQRSSAFAVLLAAFYTWLHRLGNTDDLVVGVPFSEQNSLGMDTLVGQAANTLPIRAKIDPKEPFADLLKRTWESLLDAQENTHYTFGQLLENLDIRHDPSRIPLVSVLFNIDPAMTKVKFTGLQHRFFAAPRFYYQFDLGFNLVEETEGLRIECDYNTALFDGEIVHEWLQGYVTLLHTIVDQPAPNVNQLALVDQTNQHWLTNRETNLDSQTESDVLFELNEDLQTRADQIKTCISETLETAKQSTSEQSTNVQRIVVLGSHSRDFHAAIYAVIQLGFTAIPIDPQLGKAQVQAILEDSSPALVLTTTQEIELLPSSSLTRISLDQIDRTDSPSSNSPIASNPLPEVALRLYHTEPESDSLTTIEVSRDQLVDTIRALRNCFARLENKSVLSWHTPSSEHALLEWLLPAAIAAEPVFLDSNNYTMSESLASENSNIVSGLKRSLDETGTRVLLATPTVLRQLLRMSWSGRKDLTILIVGDVPDDTLVQSLCEKCQDAWSLFGQLETTVLAATNQLIANGGIVNALSCASIGEPFSNLDISVVDDDSKPVPAGVPGHIAIRKRTGSHQPEILRTSIRGRRLGDGSVERLPSLESHVMVRGRDVDTHEVAKQLRKLDEVNDAFVLMRDDLDDAPQIVAYVLGKQDESSAELTQTLSKTIHRKLRQQLPAYMLPSNYVLLDQVPLTADGTIDGRQLPKPPSQSVGDWRNEDATGATQEALVNIWKDVLKLDRVGVEDNFFELGGQSLMAVKVFARIESELGRKLPLATLFQSPTIQQLAEAIDDQGAESGGWPSLINIQPEGLRKPLFLVHGAGGNVLLYQALTQYLAPDYPLYGLQSQGLDGKSEPLHSIEDMAERYLEEIREVQPHGPYYLGGYCLGGTVAYEMAQRLHHDGEQVALVAMLDTYNFGRALKSSMLGFLLQKLRFHIGNLIGIRPHHMMEYFKEKFRVARDGEFANLFTSRPGFEVAEDAGRATSGVELEVQGINDTAAEVYVPRPYAGKLTLFKPRINYKFYPDPKMGWGDLALGGLDIVEFPFNPHAMLVEPYVQQLAEALIQRMNSSTLDEHPVASPQLAVPPTDELATR